MCIVFISRSAIEQNSKLNSTHLLSSSEDSRYAIRSSPSWSSKWMSPPRVFPTQLVCIPCLPNSSHMSSPSTLVYFIILLSTSLYFQAFVICVRPSKEDYVTHPYRTTGKLRLLVCVSGFVQ